MEPSPKLSITDSDLIERTLSSQASFYRHFQTAGPCLNIFDGSPNPEQLKAFIRVLRPGDCLIQAVKALPQSPALDGQIRSLAMAMLGAAGRGVMYERPEQVVTEAHGQSVILAMTGYDVQNPGVLSELIIDKVLGMQSPFSLMFPPVGEVSKALFEAGEYQVLASFCERISSVEDDNDLACIIGNTQRPFMDRFVEERDIGDGKLAYRLHQLDCEVMGSKLDVSLEDYLGVEPEQSASASLTARR